MSSSTLLFSGLHVVYGGGVDLCAAPSCWCSWCVFFPWRCFTSKIPNPMATKAEIVGIRIYRNSFPLYESSPAESPRCVSIGCISLWVCIGCISFGAAPAWRSKSFAKDALCLPGFLPLGVSAMDPPTEMLPARAWSFTALGKTNPFEETQSEPKNIIQCTLDCNWDCSMLNSALSKQNRSTVVSKMEQANKTYCQLLSPSWPHRNDVLK